MKNAIEEPIEMTAEERSFIDRFTADYCRPHRDVVAERLAAFVRARQLQLLASAGAGFALAAGDSAPKAPAVEAPDEEVRLARLQAVSTMLCTELVVPPKATSETMLALTVRDRSGAAAAGVFALAGVALPLVGGRAELPFGLFLAGIKNTDVSLTAPAGAKVPGRLLFF